MHDAIVVMMVMINYAYMRSLAHEIIFLSNSMNFSKVDPSKKILENVSVSLSIIIIDLHNYMRLHLEFFENYSKESKSTFLSTCAIFYINYPGDVRIIIVLHASYHCYKKLLAINIFFYVVI